MANKKEKLKIEDKRESCIGSFAVGKRVSGPGFHRRTL